MGLLHLDVVGYLDITTASELIEEENDYTGKYHNHLKMGGYKIFLDGSPQGKTAWMTDPYEGEKDYCGYPIYKDEQLRTYIRPVSYTHLDVYKRQVQRRSAERARLLP